MRKLAAGLVSVSLLFALVSPLVGVAGAAPVVVGQTAPTSPEPCDFSEPGDEIQLGVASGAHYFFPLTGTVTSWSTFASAISGQTQTFKVFRKTAPFTYLVVAEDKRALTPGVLNTFQVAIPVQAGDFLGLGEPGSGASTPCAFPGVLGDDVMYAEGSTVAPGGTVVFPGILEGETRLNVSATAQKAPTITAIAPASGSVKGASVTISGTDFAGVTAVSFGGVAATGFSVDSEAQITATAPASKTLSQVPVTVTTVAGTATGPTAFSYEGCKVPKLKGSKLKAAKRKARKAGCRIGKVTRLKGASAKTGKVRKQSPKPGKVLAPGSKVKVTLKG